MVKKILFVMTRSPLDGVYVREALDVVMTTAAFDQQVGLLFIDDGIYQILRDQNAAAIESKDNGPIYQALEVYDIKDYYVEAESMDERGIDDGNLLLPVTTVPRSGIEALMLGYDVIYTS